MSERLIRAETSEGILSSGDLEGLAQHLAANCSQQVKLLWNDPAGMEYKIPVATPEARAMMASWVGCIAQALVGSWVENGPWRGRPATLIGFVQDWDQSEVIPKPIVTWISGARTLEYIEELHPIGPEMQEKIRKLRGS